MGGLQVLEDAFSAQGFHMLGFYSNNFGNPPQGGTEEQVEACTNEYNVTFAQFKMDDVLPQGASPARPVWDWILQQTNPGPATSIEPSWNFHKYLISKEGEIVKHWGQSTAPPTSASDPNFDTNEIVVAIEAELAQ